MRNKIHMKKVAVGSFVQNSMSSSTIQTTEVIDCLRKVFLINIVPVKIHQFKSVWYEYIVYFLTYLFIFIIKDSFT